MANNFPQVMTIAGSDSDGSAGMQADLETFFARNVYGTSVVTACVAGNSYGITNSVNLPLKFIDEEFKDIAADYHIRAAKTGMLSDGKIVDEVAKNYQEHDFGPLVVDPVITTKFGEKLLEEEAFVAMKFQLIPLATVLTPNFYEAQILTGLDPDDSNFMKKAARILQEEGAKNIIVKGRHDDPSQKTVTDFVMLEGGRTFELEGIYYSTDHKNGTGDTLSACITAELAKGENVEDSIRISKRYVDQCIENEIDVAHKYGPINHWNK